MTLLPQSHFARIERLPPYVFSITSELKMEARRRGEDIIDFGMGNPDGPTPPHIVAKLVETVQRGDTHGYSVSKGIPRLRRAICHWYERRWDVQFDPESEAIVTIGSKEGIAHLVLATLGRGDTVLVPNPSYPIHIYGPMIAGADIRSGATDARCRFLRRARADIQLSVPEAEDADRELPGEPDRAVRRAAVLREDHRAGEGVRHLGRPRPCLRRHLLRWLEGAVDHAGARGARCCGRVLHDVEELQHGRLAHRLHGRQSRPGQRAVAHQGLSRLRHVHAAPGRGDRRARRAAGLRRGDHAEIPEAARCAGAAACTKPAGWSKCPRRRCTCGRRSPDAYQSIGSLEFSKQLLAKAKVSVSPGIGFGEFGDGHVRIRDDRERGAQPPGRSAAIKQMFREDGLLK